MIRKRIDCPKHAPEIPLDHDFTISELHGPNQSACTCGFGQPNGVTSSEVSRHISRVVYRMVPLAEHEELLARERESRKQAEAALLKLERLMVELYPGHVEPDAEHLGEYQAVWTAVHDAREVMSKSVKEPAERESGK